MGRQMPAPPVPAGALSHHRAARHGEVRAPAALAVAFAAILHALLPNRLLVEPRWVVPAVEAALLIPLVAVNPQRLTRETVWSRRCGLALSAVVILTNLVSLGFLLRALTISHITDGRELLLAALQIFLTNIVAFALVYWELDRGGAVARLPSSGIPTRRIDFWFPQDDPDLHEPDWIPLFTDYLFVAVTNSTAFSPTDTMPLSTRAKALMGLQALIATVTSLLVISRAVGILR